MIKLVLGNVGSGKTASIVREMKNKPFLTYYTNIKTRGLKNVHEIKPSMIIKKEHLKTKRTGEEVYKYKLNEEFWRNLIKSKKGINIVLDEAHTLFNPRRSMSKVNQIMGDFLALLRRVLGGTGQREGQLILITQLSRRLDVYAREMATEVTFYKNHYFVICRKCGVYFRENNESPHKPDECIKCGSYRLEKKNFTIEILKFTNIDDFLIYQNTGNKTYFDHYIINDIETVFNIYDTLQWDNLLDEFH